MQEISLYTYWSHSCCLSVIVFNFTVFPQFSIILCGHGICVILWKLTIIHCDSLWVKLPKTSVFHTRTFCRTPCYSLWGSNIRKDERSKTWCNHLHVMKQATEKSEKKKKGEKKMVSEKAGTNPSVCPTVTPLCFSLLNVKDDWQKSLFPR